MEIKRNDNGKLEVKITIPEVTIPEKEISQVVDLAQKKGLRNFKQSKVDFLMSEIAELDSEISEIEAFEAQEKDI
jgi:phage terminase Nu1 subunit (DNA packaging protein)